MHSLKKNYNIVYWKDIFEIDDIIGPAIVWW